MIPIYVNANDINQKKLESATMNFKFITVLCAFFALAYSEGNYSFRYSYQTMKVLYAIFKPN